MLDFYFPDNFGGQADPIDLMESEEGVEGLYLTPDLTPENVLGGTFYIPREDNAAPVFG